MNAPKKAVKPRGKAISLSPHFGTQRNPWTCEKQAEPPATVNSGGLKVFQTPQWRNIFERLALDKKNYRSRG